MRARRGLTTDYALRKINGQRRSFLAMLLVYEGEEEKDRIA